MIEFDRLDMAGRAEALGISCREYVALGNGDSRIVTRPSLAAPGSLIRLRRWLAAGSPSPDFARLQFRGSDWARDVVLSVLERMPKPVSWHLCEYVIVREVGSCAGGWMCSALTPRHPDGDRAHEIELCGRTDEESLASVFAHEAGHSWSRLVASFVVPAVTMSDRELTARKILVYRDAGITIEQLVKEEVDEERLADQLATLWGYPRFTDEVRLRDVFTDEHTDAVELSDQIGEELAAKIEQENELEIRGAA